MRQEQKKYSRRYRYKAERTQNKYDGGKVTNIVVLFKITEENK
jgi:hypothetical protein